MAIATRTPQRKATPEDKARLAADITRLRARDEENVTGIFKNIETPGGGAYFRFKAWPGQEYDEYELHDGERYTIPRMVARHLNNNCYYKDYKHADSAFFNSGEVRVAAPADGRMRPKEQMAIMRKVHRYSFQSLEFMDEDIDMYPADILQVTHDPVLQEKVFQATDGGKAKAMRA